MKPDEQIDLLEESMRKLKAKYDLFFAGSIRLPPLEDRRRVEAFIHELSRDPIRENARRFRFNTLLSRYNQYRELWGRRMREREEGPLDFKRRAAALSEPAPPPAEERPQRPVTSPPSDSYVKVRPGSDGEAYRQLHEQIAAAQKQLGGAALSLEQVTSMVQRQAEALRARFGVSSVAFRVETVEGKVKLKARPVDER